MFLFMKMLRRILSAAKGVADRRSSAQDVIGVEFVVVGNEVIVRFRPDKNAFEEAIVQAKACMHQKVSIVHIGAASVSVEAGCGFLIKDQSFSADTRHEVASKSRREVASVHPIHVVQDGAEVLISVVETFFGAEGTFDIQPAGIFRKVLQTEVSKNAPAFRRGNEGQGCAFGSRRLEDAAADSGVDLLRVCAAGECSKQANYGKKTFHKSEFSLANPWRDFRIPAALLLWQPGNRGLAENRELRTKNSWHRSGSFTLDR